MKIDVSVIIPIFGNIHTERLFASIDSILLQTGISIEIIVSEQTTGEALPIQKRYPNVLHVVSAPSIVEGKEQYNAGVARNRGIKQATGEYVYFTDADVVLCDPEYLSNLYHQIRPREVLIRPAMWRVLQSEVPRFLKIHTNEGLEAALAQIMFKKHSLASFSDSVARVDLITHQNKIFSATPEDLKEYAKNPSLQGQENLLWQRIVHCGGIFSRKKYIESVGGYSTRYPVCVYEDSDLQWKLREKFTVRELHGDGKYAVLHLDHALSYRSVSQENDNKNIFEQRKLRGRVSAIEEDLATL